MKPPFFLASSLAKNNCRVAASALLLGLLLQSSSAQAQPSVPAPNGDTKTRWVAIDDQIVPAGAVIGNHARKDLSPLSLAPKARLWPGGRVPYTYDEKMTADKKAVFESACREWEKYANLRFSPRSGQANYLIVTSTKDLSNSPIGMIGGGQALNLADGANKIDAMHEIAHALGVIHEQSRPDRDTYITVNLDNVADGKASNFEKIAGAFSLGFYDFNSMMHAGRLAFSKNGKDTITAKADYTQFQNTMGQRSYVSEGDKSGMALLYGEPGPNARGILKPALPKTRDILTATPTGKGTPASYSYRWRKNGALIVGETSNMLDLGKPGNGDKGDRITVIITGPDEGGARSQEEALVTIINSAPKIKPAPQFKTVNTKKLEGQLTGSDDDEDVLTFIVVTTTEKGALKLERNGSFTYQPNADFIGTDGFKAAANDGETSSLPETFSIKVEQDNKPPVFENMNLRATVNFPFTGRLGATDPNGDELFYELTDGTLPDGLELSSDGTITGTPTTLQTTQATIRVEDGNGADATAKVTIEVKADDRAPTVRVTIAPLAPKTNETITVTAEVKDLTGGEVTKVYNFSVNGKLVQSGSSKTLDLSVAGQGDKGVSITCEVTATNEGGGKGTGSATVTVANSEPFARSGSGTARADTLTDFNLGGFEPDNEPLRINIVGGPEHGTASVAKGKDGRFKLFYQSRPAFNGTDVIRFTVSDGQATSSNTSTFAIDVKYTSPAPENRAPVAGNTTINTYIGESVTKVLLGSDPDGDALTFRIVNNARFGKSEIKRDKDGLWKLFYTSLNRFYDSDRVTYIAIDSKGKQSNIATIAIRFINRAPVAQANRIVVASGASVSQYLFARDPDNDAVEFRLVNNPRYGKGEIKRDEQGAWRVYYQSVAGYVGVDRINFIAIDGKGKQSAPATIEIKVVRVTETPSAGNAIQSGGGGASGGGAASAAPSAGGS